jgi:hypothetical protein
MRSPGATSLAGFAATPFSLTLPPFTAAVAMLRVL